MFVTGISLAIWQGLAWAIFAITEGVEIAMIAAGASVANTLLNVFILKKAGNVQSLAKQAVYEQSIERGQTVWRKVEEMPDGTTVIHIRKVKPPDAEDPQHGEPNGTFEPIDPGPPPNQIPSD